MKKVIVLFFLGISFANAADFKQIRCSMPGDHPGDAYSYYTVTPLENDEYDVKGFYNPDDHQEHQILGFRANHCKFQDAIFRCAHRLDKESGGSWQIMVDNERYTVETMYSSGKVLARHWFKPTFMQTTADQSIDWGLIRMLGLKELPFQRVLCRVEK